jgi:hypothetical protein
MADGEFLNAANTHFPAVVVGWSAAQILGIPGLRFPPQAQGNDLHCQGAAAAEHVGGDDPLKACGGSPPLPHPP